MAYQETERAAVKSHAVSMENREKLRLTGVEDVSGFDESLIVLTTDIGALNIRGEGLHIDRIDLDSGQLDVRGRISELSYDEAAPSSSFWSRLFG